MEAAALGLVIAAAFGSGDFVGGRASVSASTVAVLVVAQLCSVAGALVLALTVSGQITGGDLLLGGIAGAVNVAGLGLLYNGLARYSAAVVAPIAAVMGAMVPIGWGLLDGERPSTAVFAGIVLAVLAGGLISLERTTGATVGVTRGAVQAVAAGALLGSSLVLFSNTSGDSGQWPVFAARTAAFAAVSVAAVVLARRGSVRFPVHHARLLAIAAGVFDVAATALLLVAVRRELMVVVAPLAALAPAFTVVLAWAILREPFRRIQAVGLVMALAGLALIATG